MTDLISVTYANLKPGTTKTTSAVFTAAALHARGLSTLLVDADPAASAQRWADAAGGFPWNTIGLARKTIARELPETLRHMPDVQAVVIDTPQMEDHAAIARGALSVTNTWIVPVAPAGIEVERTATVGDHMDEVDSIRRTPGRRFVLLTRTNRKLAPLSGPDAEARVAFVKAGWDVFPAQVPNEDRAYRRPYGTVPDGEDTPYWHLAHYLIMAADHGTTLADYAFQYHTTLKAERDRVVYGTA
jgi:chromosome partitioning protein